MKDGRVILDTATEKALGTEKAAVQAEIQALAEKVPNAELPTTAGNYQLTVTVADDVVSYSWTAIA